MRATLISGLVLVAGGLAFLTWQYLFSAPPASQPGAWECNGDVKICPDGSSVGRTGPSCEFAPCPPEDRKEALVTTFLGGSATAIQVTVAPKEIISDSRCPEGAQCIWAGTVEVRTVLSTPVSHGEHTMRLGESQTFGEYIVTLVSVVPYPKADEEILDSAYRFTFKIRKE